jgi:pimeloyl-ACP methyl ester carboxylesterase
VRLVAWVGEMGWARRALERAIEEARRKKREREGEDGEHELGTVEEERKDLMRMLLEAFKQGGAPTVREFHLLANEWGFELRHVDFDKVILWHGTKDVNAPVSGARYMAEALPHAELREYEGTHGEIITQIDDILETLVPKNDETSA